MTNKPPRQPNFVTADPMSAPLQGQDAIIIAVPVECLWPLIADSRRLLDWGPPVTHVEVLGTADHREDVGSYRRVEANFNGKAGHFIERRIEQIAPQRMRFVIEEETFGLARIMQDTGSALDLEPVGTRQTRVLFSFFHRPVRLSSTLHIDSKK